MVRRVLIAAGIALLLSGCGDSGAARRPAKTPAPRAFAQSHAPVLAELTQQRPGALIDKITVRVDGTGLFDRPSGGVGRVQRDVELFPAVLTRLRSDLRALPRRTGRGDGSPAANGATYILRYRGRTYVARQGAEPPALRHPLRLLAGLLVGDGIREVTRERLGGAAGATHASGVGKPKKAPALVFAQRQGEGGATLDAITVRRDGTATLEKRHGGAGGRFKEQVLGRGVLPRLKAALARLPRSGGSLMRGSPPPGAAQYLLRYRGRTLTAARGVTIPRARRAVRLLDDLINGIGVRATTRDRATHTY